MSDSCDFHSYLMCNHFLRIESIYWYGCQLIYAPIEFSLFDWKIQNNFDSRLECGVWHNESNFFFVMILTRGIVVTGVLSKYSHSIFGGGDPFATQSMWLSIIFVNSKWCGGSIVNDGPWISNGSAITHRSIYVGKREINWWDETQNICENVIYFVIKRTSVGKKNECLNWTKIIYVICIHLHAKALTTEIRALLSQRFYTKTIHTYAHYIHVNWE